MKPKVSIIIPTFNGWEDTKECLRSIIKLSYPQAKIEVIVVDNDSADGTVEKIKKLQNSLPAQAGKTPSFKIKLIESRTNLGFARAANQGIKKASGDYLFIINNDMVFDKNFLAYLINFMEKDEKIGIAGGKIYSQKSKKIVFSGHTFNPWTGEIINLPQPNQTKESDWIQGCTMLVKRKVVDQIGLFDPSFFFSFEDLDFCRRAKRAGFKIIYYPKAIAWHKEGSTIDKMGFRKKALELYKAKFYYLFKNCTLLQITTSTLAQFLIIAPYRKFIIKDQYFFIRPVLSGYLYNLKRLPKILKQRK
jgi:GT2 family glycosyltransferase